MLLDRKLTFVPHLRNLKNKCMTTINNLKVLSCTTWGSDAKCLLNLYRSLVQSHLDYGAIIYESVTPSTRKMLNPIHHLGVRLSTGTFRTSPVSTLTRNEWSLYLQTSYLLSFMWFLKVTANKEHPTYATIHNLSSSQIFQNCPTLTEPYPLCVRGLADEMGVSLNEYNVMPPAAQLPPWQWLLVQCDLSFTTVTKCAPLVRLTSRATLAFNCLSRLCTLFHDDAARSSSIIVSTS